MEKNITSFTGKYPAQLWLLFSSELWERFCFYGMRGMLAYYMGTELNFSEAQSNLQYGATQAFVYAFTFIGGIAADKILGFRKSLFWGGILMIIGSLLLAINPKDFFFLGISFNIVGTGFFKPNISSMVGQLYEDNDPRKDAGFLLFYSGINIGAFLGGYLIAIGKGTMFTSLVPENLRWNIAFGASGIAMTISLLIFLYTKRKIGNIGISPIQTETKSKRLSKELLVFGGALLAIPLIKLMVTNTVYTDWFMTLIGPFAIIYLIIEMSKSTAEENRKIGAALIFILVSILFWAIFEQAGGSLSFFANGLQNKLLAIISIDPNVVNNSANSLFVILFAVPVGLIFIKLANWKLEPHAVFKNCYAFVFLALGFFVFYLTGNSVDEKGLGSLNLFTTGYLIVSIGELLISPVGMSLMTKLAPLRMQGLMMGLWFLASAYGQYVAGLFGAGISPNENANNTEKLAIYAEGYHTFAIYACCGAVILILGYPLIKKLMK